MLSKPSLRIRPDSLRFKRNDGDIETIQLISRGNLGEGFRGYGLSERQVAYLRSTAEAALLYGSGNEAAVFASGSLRYITSLFKETTENWQEAYEFHKIDYLVEAVSSRVRKALKGANMFTLSNKPGEYKVNGETVTILDGGQVYTYNTEMCDALIKEGFVLLGVEESPEEVDNAAPVKAQTTTAFSPDKPVLEPVTKTKKESPAAVAKEQVSPDL